jgi:hypothetical protein
MDYYDLKIPVADSLSTDSSVLEVLTGGARQTVERFTSLSKRRLSHRTCLRLKMSSSTNLTDLGPVLYDKETGTDEDIEWSRRIHQQWKEGMKREFGLEDLTSEELKKFVESTTKKISRGLKKQFKNTREAMRSLRFR